MKKILLMIIVLLFLLTSITSFASVYVKGYTKSNGTYVAPHYRSGPDGNFSNNWSTKGNTNPYTGEEGTKVTPPSGYNSTNSTPSYSPPSTNSLSQSNVLPSNNQTMPSLGSSYVPANSISMASGQLQMWNFLGTITPLIPKTGQPLYKYAW